MLDFKISCIVINNSKCNFFATLQSVMNQTYANLECIVVNSACCNEQEVNEILKKKFFTLFEYDSKDENVLLSEAIAICSGDFVVVLTGDRYFYDSNVILNFFSDISETDDIIYGNMIKMYPDGIYETVLYSEKISLENLLYHYLDLFPVAFIRKRLFNEFGLYYKEFPLTSKMLFLIKAFMLNNLNTKYKNYSVVYQKVNRSGGLNKFSDAHLLSKERDRLIETFFSDSLKRFLYEKTELVNYFNNARTMSVVRSLEKGKHFLLKLINPIFNKVKFGVQSFITTLQLFFYKKKHSNDVYNIPIIINNRNHLSYLVKLIKSLEIRGYKNIFIIDNNSNYPPLKEYYNQIPYKVFDLKENVGFCALWDTDIYDNFKDNYYVYTDSDLELVEECPKDFLVVMQYLLNKYRVGKVGLSLLTNDLPDSFTNKEEVIDWEYQFQKNVIEKLVCKAQVDTTFALYSPGKFGHAAILTSLRSRFPYSARHLPWYENTRHLTSEQKYYYSNAKTSSHWSNKVRVDDFETNK